LDRYNASILKAQVARRNEQTQKFAYYDAFTDRRQNPVATLPAGRDERRKAAA
jgi:hypothetical protein